MCPNDPSPTPRDKSEGDPPPTPHKVLQGDKAEGIPPHPSTGPSKGIRLRVIPPPPPFYSCFWIFTYRYMMYMLVMGSALVKYMSIPDARPIVKGSWFYLLFSDPKYSM